MEILLLVVLLVLIIVLLMRQSETRDRLAGEINNLSKVVGSLEKQIQQLRQGPPIDILPKPVPPPEKPKPVQEIIPPAPVPKPTPPPIEPLFP